MGTSNGTSPSIVSPKNGRLPQHVAIIMDGNGRWAKGKFLPRIEGHRAGAKAVRSTVEECRKLGIRYLTLYTFSTENWGRPADEVGALMKLLERYLESELELMLKNDIRLRSIGDLSRLPPSTRAILERVMEQTRNHSSMDLVLALSYGSREELVQAARKIALAAITGDISPEQITEDTIRQNLYGPDIPDPDLLIRTSDECRISNFLLWQLAYTEIVVTPVFWPDFSVDEFHRCLKEFEQRERRFGLTHEQIALNG